MAVSFRTEKHEYKSIDPNDTTQWLGVTSFVSLFKQPFDAIAVSEKQSKKKKSKWYGIPPEKIREIWKKEGERGMSLGTFYHNERESDLMLIDTLQRSGVSLPIIKPIMEGDLKIAPSQRLVNGIYPEHFVYLKSAGVCGQSDRVEVVNGFVDIIDYKTNKEIKLKGFTSWDGTSTKMTGIMGHLDDCEFNHYALQLSLYMYMIIKHNPTLKPGKIQIHHILFEETGRDQYDYPITKYDEKGSPIVKEIVPYDLPYLKNEVIQMINWLHDNPKARFKKH